MWLPCRWQFKKKKVNSNIESIGTLDVHICRSLYVKNILQNYSIMSYMIGLHWYRQRPFPEWGHVFGQFYKQFEIQDVGANIEKCCLQTKTDGNLENKWPAALHYFLCDGRTSSTSFTSTLLSLFSLIGQVYPRKENIWTRDSNITYNMHGLASSNVLLTPRGHVADGNCQKYKVLLIFF